MQLTQLHAPLSLWLLTLRPVHAALVQNDPLYLRTFTSNNPSSASSPSSVPFASSSLNPAAAGPLNWNNDQGLKFHYFVHTSLDAIEEKSTNHTHAHRR